MRRVVLAGILGFGMIAGAIGFAAPDNAAADWWNNGWLEERPGRDSDPDGPFLTGNPPTPDSESNADEASVSLEQLLEFIIKDLLEPLGL